MTALVVACQNRDVAMVELLLKYDARDDDAKALSVAVKHGEDALISKLLVIKVSALSCVYAQKFLLTNENPDNVECVYRHILIQSTK